MRLRYRGASGDVGLWSVPRSMTHGWLVQSSATLQHFPRRLKLFWVQVNFWWDPEAKRKDLQTDKVFITSATNNLFGPFGTNLSDQRTNIMSRFTARRKLRRTCQHLSLALLKYQSRHWCFFLFVIIVYPQVTCFGNRYHVSSILFRCNSQS